MGTVVTYNGITLFNTQTRLWDQEVRRDPSDTDVYYHLFRFRFETVLHRHALDGDGNQTDLGSMVTNYKDLQSKLLKPRQTLVIYVSDAGGNLQEIFRCRPCAGDINTYAGGLMLDPEHDVDNGPKPVSFRILHVAGAQCMRSSYEITCAKVVCEDNYRTGSGDSISAMPLVLNNRWSADEAMDDNYFITRTIAGKLRLANPAAATGVTGKSLVVPGLEIGFKRQALNFTTNTNGLECDYRVIDRQVHTAAPWPATKMSARHTEATNDGVNLSSAMQVELTGAPNSDKKMLIGRAIEIADARLNFLKNAKDFAETHVIEEIGVTDFVGPENRVEMTIRYLEVPHDKTNPIGQLIGNLANAMGSRIENLETLPGQPEPYDPLRSWTPALYGYNPQSMADRSPATLLLLQCYLQQPCVDRHAIAQWENEPTEESEPYDGYNTNYPATVNQYPEGSLNYPADDEYSKSAKSSLYTVATVSNRYLINQCRVQLPIARASTAANATAPTSKVFRLAPPQCRRVIEMDIERATKQPEIITPVDTYTDGDLTGTLLRHWLEPHPPTLSADGRTKLYRVTAYYVYALNRPPTLQEQFHLAVSPYTKYEKDDDEVQFDPDSYTERLGP